ncbi:hypothetical protein GPECTOR_17g899 [Gonium pectorale]|uniref:Elongator complex protein 6 n=1 Tax=Gonium pectorale TaxID=33097 RepID=A0A150GKE9_GONPE|nr:hypothetical protein GPECTOR_17g899 [Gonium pectorale]|eukprot:KXZ50261.1 hypothetical protein GPECTOR_17g899 [Gonium pectorale]
MCSLYTLAMNEDAFLQLGEESCRGGLTLVKGSLRLPGLFVLQQYLRLFLQKNYMVVLVTAEQSPEHFKYAARKAGLSLQPFLESGQLTCVEPPLAPTPTLTPAAEAAPAEAVGAGRAASPQPLHAAEAETTTDKSALEAGGGGGSAGGGVAAPGPGSQLHALYAAVRNAVQRRPRGAAGVAVLLDSLTAVLSVEPLPGRIADVDGMSLYFRSTDLAIKWMPLVTAHELL